MDSKRIIEHIVNWLKDYSSHSNTNGFVVGISGGIDSALTSTLCALTSKKVIVLNLPIKQNKTEFEKIINHVIVLDKYIEKYQNFYKINKVIRKK